MASLRLRVRRGGATMLLAAPLVGLLGVAFVSPAGSQMDAAVIERWIEKGRPAIIDLGRPKGGESGLLTMQITVRPATVEPDDSFLLRVDLVSSADFKVLGTKSPSSASGTVGFFPPAVVGVERTFFVPIFPNEGADLSKSVTAIVRLVPGHPDRELGKASVEVTNARLL